MNQKIMDRLQHAKCLVITFNHLLVYSAKYGVRRHCTKLVVRPPVGCIHATTPNEPDAMQLMLPELIGRRKTLVEDEENDQSGVSGVNTPSSRNSSQGSVHKDHQLGPSKEKLKSIASKTSTSKSTGLCSSKYLRLISYPFLTYNFPPTSIMPWDNVAGAGLGAEAYFVGEVELHRVVSFPLDHINDAMLQAWLRDGKEGCVEIDLFRYMMLHPLIIGLISTALA